MFKNIMDQIDRLSQNMERTNNNLEAVRDNGGTIIVLIVVLICVMALGVFSRKSE